MGNKELLERISLNPRVMIGKPVIKKIIGTGELYMHWVKVIHPGLLLNFLEYRLIEGQVGQKSIRMIKRSNK